MGVPPVIIYFSGIFMEHTPLQRTAGVPPFSGNLRLETSNAKHPAGDPCAERDLRAGSHPQGDRRGQPPFKSSALEAPRALGVLCHSSAHQDAGGKGVNAWDGELED